MTFLLPDNFNKDEFISSKTWPALEAKRILEKIGGKTPEKGYVLFETGYGPSGLPHIGTFGEVVRVKYVQFAFWLLAPEIPTKLLCMSDDIDGLRKVPDNVPNREMVAKNLGKPLTSVPDPFETHESYGHNMNSRLRAFLDGFGFSYEFASATEYYKSGKFNHILKAVLQKYEDIMAVMLPTLGEERQATYCPFMPICPITGKVLASGVKKVNKEKETITYVNEFGDECETSIYNGNCKLQWKVDFGGRWFGLDVDYEIYGKDHYPNEPVYRKICETLGRTPPVNFFYELFLNEHGAKISKSTGNGITVNEWLTYAPNESMALFMYNKPQTAKKLYFDVIPKNVDDYLSHLAKFSEPTLSDGKDGGSAELVESNRYANPVFYIHYGSVPKLETDLSFSLLLNLVSACNAENEEVLWGFIQRYDPKIDRDSAKMTKKLVQCAINYYNDFVKNSKCYVMPNSEELVAIKDLYYKLKDAKSSGQTDAQSLQNIYYAVGNSYKFNLRSWFACLYKTLIGQEQGPRIGTFTALYGLENMLSLIETMVLNKE